MTTEQALAEITRRLVVFYRPEKIYLFGSFARGDAGPDSDLDFLVVLPDDAPEELLRSGDIYRALAGVPAADAIPWRKGGLRRPRGSCGRIPSRDGSKGGP